MHCFVTVGSTQFDNLVSAVLCENVLMTLKSMNCDKLFIQCGMGLIPKEFEECFDENTHEQYWSNSVHGILVTLFRYKNNIEEEMRRADLIIGHAGAGTCLEVLELGKPFIIVVNEGLADNHQIELATKLSADGHLLYTVPSELVDTLKNPKLFNLKRFENANPQLFSTFLDDFLKVNR